MQTQKLIPNDSTENFDQSLSTKEITYQYS